MLCFYIDSTSSIARIVYQMDEAHNINGGEDKPNNWFLHIPAQNKGTRDILSAISRCSHRQDTHSHTLIFLYLFISISSSCAPCPRNMKFSIIMIIVYIIYSSDSPPPQRSICASSKSNCAARNCHFILPPHINKSKQIESKDN